MRVIEKQMLAAIKKQKNWRCRNMKVEWLDRQRTAIPGSLNEYKVKLYGHTIFHHYRGQTRWTLAGWNTATTRSRLQALGISVVCRDFCPYFLVGWDLKGDGSLDKEIKKAIDSTGWYDAEGNEVKV